MMRNPVREELAAGRPSVGSWLNLASPLAAEVMAGAGFPWLCVDAEHAAYDMESIAHSLRAIESRGAFPLCAPGTTTRSPPAGSSTPAPGGSASPT